MSSPTPGLRSWARQVGKLKPTTWLGVVLLVITLYLALFPNTVTTHDYREQDLRARLTPPVWTEGGSWEHPLGTDHLGRDLWARIVGGARVSMLIAAGAVFVAGALGTVLGVLAGYLGGLIDEVVMRLADIQLSFAPILLVIAIMAVIGKSLLNVILVLGFVSWVQYARVIRSQTLSIKEQGYIEASRALGLSGIGIMLRHIVPNVLPTLLVISAVNASQQILNEAALSFLGLGVQPPTPAWGSMLAEGREYLQVAWWNAFFPGLAILLTVLGINLIGDSLSGRRPSA